MNVTSVLRVLHVAALYVHEQEEEDHAASGCTRGNAYAGMRMQGYKEGESQLLSQPTNQPSSYHRRCVGAIIISGMMPSSPALRPSSRSSSSSFSSSSRSLLLVVVSSSLLLLLLLSSSCADAAHTAGHGAGVAAGDPVSAALPAKGHHDKAVAVAAAAAGAGTGDKAASATAAGTAGGGSSGSAVVPAGAPASGGKSPQEQVVVTVKQFVSIINSSMASMVSAAKDVAEVIKTLPQVKQAQAQQQQVVASGPAAGAGCRCNNLATAATTATDVVVGCIN